ncbi:hypothetical protein FOA52_010727 [Chlamydomonas sp. UWO 241]|nr:hypothetical protein FOA52_010727 [Chlamydomonas sp. UWO 241]
MFRGTSTSTRRGYAGGSCGSLSQGDEKERERALGGGARRIEWLSSVPVLLLCLMLTSTLCLLRSDQNQLESARRDMKRMQQHIDVLANGLPTTMYVPELDGKVAVGGDGAGGGTGGPQLEALKAEFEAYKAKMANMASGSEEMQARYKALEAEFSQTSLVLRTQVTTLIKEKQMLEKIMHLGKDAAAPV